MEPTVVGLQSIDPLRWILPHDDTVYQEQLAIRAENPEQWSRLDGLYGSIGQVFGNTALCFAGPQGNVCSPQAWFAAAEYALHY
eukprot:jgi/Chrzof1/11437/Cz05g36200.t1